LGSILSTFAGGPIAKFYKAIDQRNARKQRLIVVINV
jgi:hypothetical protein